MHVGGEHDQEEAQGRDQQPEIAPGHVDRMRDVMRPAYARVRTRRTGAAIRDTLRRCASCSATTTRSSGTASSWSSAGGTRRWELVGTADAEAALHSVREAPDDVDLVLLDISLPGMDGFEALSRLRAEHPDVPVVMLSSSEERTDVRRALEGGAAGFIPKSTRGAVLVGALELVLAGGVYVPPLMVESEPPAPIAGLTERQIEVLRLIARGLTNREVCAVLGIAEGTVKTHVARIYEALEVSNRTEAAMRLRELGLDIG